MEQRWIDDKMPLLAAAEQGYEKVVEVLLRHGADAKRRNEVAMTALGLAVEGANVHIVKLLLEAEGDEKVNVILAATRLHHALLHKGDAKVLSILD